LGKIALSLLRTKPARYRRSTPPLPLLAPSPSRRRWLRATVPILIGFGQPQSCA